MKKALVSIISMLISASAFAGVFTPVDQNTGYLRITKNNEGRQTYSVCKLEADKMDLVETCRLPQSHGKTLRSNGYTRQELDTAVGAAVTAQNRALKHLGLTQVFSEDATSDDTYVGFPQDKLSDLEDALVSGLDK
jgi:hypothetical protein